MLSSILGNVLGRLGGFFGGSMLASAGRYIGNWIGNQLEDNYEEKESCTIGRVKNNLYPLSTIVGKPIPLIFGKAAADGRLIWSTSIQEVPTRSSSFRYVADTKIIKTRIDFLYYCSFALGICEGKIERIERVWCNNALIDISAYHHRIYYGTEDQMPDPLIAAKVPGRSATAHRGLAYIVFENFPLADFNNDMPKFTFEVYRRTQIYNETISLTNKIRGFNIIPGSGEFVYDTIIQTMSHIEMGSNIYTHHINKNNKDGIADSLFSLNYMQQVCPKLEWAAPVVCWFCDDLDIGRCNIFPAVENGPNNHNEYSCQWEVAGRTRSNARVISKDHYENPMYGGTVNDDSVVRYLQELKNRGLKVMFYPMIFMEVTGKPWRGYMKGEACDVPNFFRKPNGYNNFILHYARLCAGLVDAFIIGSEFVGITSIREGNSFPAVAELINLARQVKEIMGPRVKVTYAADWTEYHHSAGGWYHMDDLWASDYIDFIGIDNYLPLTMKKIGSPSTEEISRGLNSGEGFDYYYDDAREQIPLDPKYAWKNIRWFWENEHYNPDGTRTRWIPRSKKIWFTEFGFASIDKSTNQPNLFYDPRCISGGIPIYSNAGTNFITQRVAANAFLDFWSNQEYIENMFLWCFDARPYPAWPHAKKWNDFYLWEKGHWVNGKLIDTLLADLILDISQKCNICPSLIDFNGLHENISGISITKMTTGLELINLLRTVYFFDLRDRSDGGITFVKRNSSNEIKIDGKDLLQIDDKIIETEKENKYSQPGALLIRYISSTSRAYDITQEMISLDRAQYNVKSINLPFVMSASEANDVGRIILNQIHSTEAMISFCLPFIYCDLSPSDIISFRHDGVHYQARICFIELQKWRILITGVLESKMELILPNFDISDNSTIDTSEGIKQILISNAQDYKEQMNIPGILFFANFSAVIAPLKIGPGLDRLCKIDDIPKCPGGYNVINSHISQINHYLIDETSYIEIDVSNNPLPVIDRCCTKKNGLILDNQLIFFMKIERISEARVVISNLIYPKSVNNIDLCASSRALFMDTIYDLAVHAIFEEEMFYLSGGVSNKNLSQIIFMDNALNS